MRKTAYIAIFLFLPFIPRAQTPISGIINSYHKVTSFIPASAAVKVDNVSGLSITDRVMIIQMKGADFSTTNNSSFGSVNAYNNAGNYEILTICNISNDTVYFMHQFLRSYTVSEKVQLVRIPQYTSALVTDTLRAQSWDNASGKGGVLALMVADNLSLNAPVWTGSAGYSGGSYLQSSSTCSNFFAPGNYYYDASATSPQNGAYKGESICSPTAAYSGGKGAIASGGGGGNNHNNGGGGGSNLTAGGVGGGNSSASGCTVSNPGRGGYALSSNSGQRIFPGGGGGAGHANFTFVTGGGGNGGGIIFIQANTLTSNGQIIGANGQKGGSTIGDGASGGGGGGTVIMDVVNYSGNVNIQVKGGDGGDEDDDNTPEKCFGEGGGGSGGVVYFKNSTPAGTVDISGGAKGTKFNSLDCAAIISAAPGNPGTIVQNYNYMRSVTVSSCTVPLPVHLMSFKASAIGQKVNVLWKIEDENETDRFILERKHFNDDWKEITNIPVLNNQLSYGFVDVVDMPGIYQYRLKIIERNGAISYSPIEQVTIRGRSEFSMYPNPASGNITLIGKFNPGEIIGIFDITGRQVHKIVITGKAEYIQENISFLSRGVYLVKWQGEVVRLQKN